jgi:hypothetical protein
MKFNVCYDPDHGNWILEFRGPTTFPNTLEWQGLRIEFWGPWDAHCNGDQGVDQQRAEDGNLRRTTQSDAPWNQHLIGVCNWASPYLVWILVLLPTVILVLFFTMMHTKKHNLYLPSNTDIDVTEIKIVSCVLTLLSLTLWNTFSYLLLYFVSLPTVRSTRRWR